MTENMKKLIALVNEVNELTQKVEADTAAMKAQYVVNNQAKLDRIRKELAGYMEVSRELGADIYVRISGRSHYYNGQVRDSLALKIPSYERPAGAGVYDWNNGEHRSFLGYLGSDYKRAKQGDYNSNLSYDVDEIIDNWNSEKFEHDFAVAVREIIRKKAEKANRAYEEAKRRLEEQR